MKRSMWGPLALVLAVGVVTSTPVVSQEGTPSDATCLECHSDSSMAQTPLVRTGLIHGTAVDREGLTLQVTNESLKGSAHDGFACIDCHAAIKEIPHEEKLPPVKCASCHEDAQMALDAGIHRAQGKDAAYVPGCTDCHGAHQIKPASNPDSSVNHVKLLDTCGACHGDKTLMDAAGVKISDPYRNFMKSQHWQATESGATQKAATCSDCHGIHTILPSNDPSSPVNKRNIPATCGKCHGTIMHRFEKSIHGTALAAGNLEAPSCADCHGEHDIEGPTSPTSSVYPATIGKTTCPQCHASVRLAKRFDLPEGMVKSYQASFHGLASNYGNTEVANCASCHGAHDILPSSDPASTINPKNLEATCGKCHPKAGASFSRTPIHLKVSVTSSPVLFWLRAFYIWLIAAVLIGLGLHNLLDFIRRYREAIHKLKPYAVYMRMTLAERIQHWLLLSSFFILVITGFALKYPDSVWSLPFHALPAGFEWRGWLHRAAAVVMIGDGIFHLVYLAVTKRGRWFVKDILPTLQDLSDFWHQMAYYVGWRKEGAQFGRFTYGEKIEYLALLWGTLIMVATGFVLWFKTWFARFLPEWGFPAAEMVHFYEAILAFTTIIIWHLYAVFSHTETPPYNPTWLTGRMTRRDLEHHHHRQLVELERRERLKGQNAKGAGEAPEEDEGTGQET
jgi:cytochrome b subunit of formate dehydrogenase